FELATQLERAVAENRGAEGIILGGHGLFTWGNTQRECYLNSIGTIDQMGEFVAQHQEKERTLFGGPVCAPASDRAQIAIKILPTLRGAVSSNRCVIAHYTDHEDALAFVNSVSAAGQRALGTRCPAHFVCRGACRKLLP